MSRTADATIDGSDVLFSGTLVIPPGRKGVLRFGGLSISLNFRRSGGAPSFSAEQGLLGATLNLDNFDNSLGTHVEVSGFVIQGQTAKLSLVVHSVGDTQPARTVNYTVFSG